MLSNSPKVRAVTQIILTKNSRAGLTDTNRAEPGQLEERVPNAAETDTWTQLLQARGARRQAAEEEPILRDGDHLPRTPDSKTPFRGWH